MPGQYTQPESESAVGQAMLSAVLWVIFSILFIMVATTYEFLPAAASRFGVWFGMALKIACIADTIRTKTATKLFQALAILIHWSPGNWLRI
jgi:hypothetical protein